MCISDLVCRRALACTNCVLHIESAPFVYSIAQVVSDSRASLMYFYVCQPALSKLISSTHAQRNGV